MKISVKSRSELLLFQLFVLLTFSVVAATAQTKPNLAETDRIRLAEAFQLSDKLAAKTWPGWNRAPFAVLLVTPQVEFLIGHPSPTKEFALVGHDKTLRSNVYWRKRQFDKTFLATFPAVGGIPTIVVGQAENTWVKNSTPWVVTILHEHFHQFQDSRPGIYGEILKLGLDGGDTSGMWMLNYKFPYDDAKVGRDFAALAGQLARTLETSEKATFSAEFAVYLKMRSAFAASLDKKDYRYLSFQIWKEGVARYAEIKIAEKAATGYRPRSDFRKLPDFESYKSISDEWKSTVLADLKSMKLAETRREVVYSFGAAEAMALDRAGIDWRTSYFSDSFDIFSFKAR